MSKLKWQQKHLDFLKENKPLLDNDDLLLSFNEAFNLNQSKSSIKNALIYYKIKVRRSPSKNKGKYKLFTNVQADWLHKNYQLMSRKELAKEFQRVFASTLTYQQILAFLKNHKIRSGRTGHFKKGQVSWNKSTKGVMKANNTSFKKGLKPFNKRPVGSERVNADGYIEIKTAEPRTWEAKHRVIYQKNNPDVILKATDIIRFIDNDRTNLDPSNLSLFTRSENMIATQKGYSNALPEHKQTIKLIAKVISKTYQLQDEKRPL